MSFRRPVVLLVRSLVLVFIAFQLVAMNQNWADNWAFVGLYCVAALVAAWCRAWLAVAAAASVAVVRGMVAADITGDAFRVASVAFAALFFALVVAYAQQRRELRARKDSPNEDDPE